MEVNTEEVTDERTRADDSSTMDTGDLTVAVAPAAATDDIARISQQEVLIHGSSLDSSAMMDLHSSATSVDFELGQSSHDAHQTALPVLLSSCMLPDSSASTDHDSSLPELGKPVMDVSEHFPKESCLAQPNVSDVEESSSLDSSHNDRKNSNLQRTQVGQELNTSNLTMCEANTTDVQNLLASDNTVLEEHDHHSTEDSAQDRNDSDSPAEPSIVDLEMEQAEWRIDYDFSQPKLVVKETETFSHSHNNYLRGCKWSPDGTCLLSNSNDNRLRLFNLPQSLWNKEHSDIDRLELALTMPEGGLVYDYCWYPLMSSQNADSCVLACTGRGLPVHLWDAFTGQIRCVYKPYDHLDELTSAKTIAFNRAGDKIYCGFEKQIRVFDTSRPGRECEMFNYKSTKKRQVRGQSGIMSSISFHHDDTMFAVGTYGKSVGLYSSETNKCVRLLRGHASGVTQVQFLPNGNHLLSGTRKDNEIFCWDIRFTRAPVYRVQRLVKTNQRMLFSTDVLGRYLVSGNHDGRVNVWDLTGNPVDDSDILAPICEFKAHEDTANGVDFHPFLPVIASASGQYHYKSVLSLGSDGDSESDEEERFNVDNSLKLWWVGASASTDSPGNGTDIV